MQKCNMHIFKCTRLTIMTGILENKEKSKYVMVRSTDLEFR